MQMSTTAAAPAAWSARSAMFCASRGKRFVFRTASDADCKPDALISMGRWYRRDKWLYEHGLRRASSVLVQSVRQQELMRRNFGLDSSIAGLSWSRAQRPRVRRAGHRRALGEQHALGEAAGCVAEHRRSTAAVSFHMVGGTVPGGHRFFETVKAQAASRSNVTFHGAVPYRDASALYSRARVFVNTSDIEGFPNTYLQAWASGTPVVAFFDPDGVIAREGLGATVRTCAGDARGRAALDERRVRMEGGARRAASPSSSGTTAKTQCCSRTWTFRREIKKAGGVATADLSKGSSRID